MKSGVAPAGNGRAALRRRATDVYFTPDSRCPEAPPEGAMKPSAKRFLMIFAGLLLVACGAALLHAHVSILVTGKIVKWDRPWLTVSSKEHGVVKIKVEDDFATILHAGKPGALTDLKVGHQVLIDAWGDTLDDAEALKVDIDPVKTPQKK